MGIHLAVADLETILTSACTFNVARTQLRVNLMSEVHREPPIVAWFLMTELPIELIAL